MVVVGESVFFTCRGSGISSVLWIVNGTKFTDSSLNGVTTGFIDSTSNLQDIGILNFHMAILEYNNMTIQCEVTLNSGSVLMSTVIPMLVQGKYGKCAFSLVVAFPVQILYSRNGSTLLLFSLYIFLLHH